MAENTKENQKSAFSLEVTRVSLTEDVQTARILFQEGLLEEAKKTLYQILLRSPGYTRAQELLQQIRAVEEKDLLLERPISRNKPPPPPKINSDELIAKLTRDLDLPLDEMEIDGTKPYWSEPQVSISSQESYDLGVAYFLMGFYYDSIRELDRTIRSVRTEQTVLGDLGLSAVVLKAESMLLMGDGFGAKLFLEPVLVEPEIPHENKAPLFYVMGRIEEMLGERTSARGWYSKTIILEPHYRDVDMRIHSVK